MTSAANAVDITPGQQTVVATDFWNDATTELSDTNLKKKVPTIPKIGNNVQVVRGTGIEIPAYLALQIVKSTDKSVIVRAMASAAAFFLKSPENFTGSPMPSVILTGLNVAAEENIDPKTVLVTNFEDEEPVTVGELLSLMEADEDELGSYFGVLFLAANKRATRKNLTAFNENRRSAISASVIGELVIFTPDSDYLGLPILERVYAAMLSHSPMRTVITSRIVERMDRYHTGPSLAFMSMFALLSNSGMSALAMIKEATLKHPWIRHEFPELRPEFTAANEAIKILKAVPEKERPFIKAIHGNAFVPVAYNQIDNLTGVCKTILKKTTPSYQNYDGGRTTDVQLNIINRHTDATGELVATVTAE